MSEDFLTTILGAPPAGWTRDYVKVRGSKVSGEHADRIVECFARGPFAIHAIESAVCGRRKELSVLSHKATGLRIEVFADVDVAAEAAEVLEPLRSDWHALDGPVIAVGAYAAVRDALDRRFERMCLDRDGIGPIVWCVRDQKGGAA